MHAVGENPLLTRAHHFREFSSPRQVYLPFLSFSLYSLIFMEENVDTKRQKKKPQKLNLF